MLDLDGSSSDVVLCEMVFGVDEFSAFGGSRVLCNEDCCFLSTKRRGRFRFGRFCVAEEAAEPMRLLGCRCGR